MYVCHSVNFVEYEKDGIRLMQGPVNEVEEISLNPVFYCWLHSSCVIRKKHNVSPIDKYILFSEKIFMHMLELLKV